MEFNKIKVGIHVEVSAEATGYGNPYTGTVTSVVTMRVYGMPQPFVSVDFDKPTPDGRRGITLTNLRLIEPAPTYSKKRAEVEDMIMRVRIGQKP